jgi:hypothetical protein
VLGATQSFVELCVDRLNQFAFVCWRRFGQMFPNRKKKTYLVNGMGGTAAEMTKYLLWHTRKGGHFIDNCLRVMAIYRRDLRPLPKMC